MFRRLITYSSSEFWVRSQVHSFSASLPDSPTDGNLCNVFEILFTVLTIEVTTHEIYIYVKQIMNQFSEYFHLNKYF